MKNVKKILNGKYVGPCRFNNEETCNKWTTDTSFKSDTLANIKSNKIKELEKEIANKRSQLSRDKKNKNLIAEILKLENEKEWYEGDQILSDLFKISRQEEEKFVLVQVRLINISPKKK